MKGLGAKVGRGTDVTIGAPMFGVPADGLTLGVPGVTSGFELQLPQVPYLGTIMDAISGDKQASKSMPTSNSIQ